MVPVLSSRMTSTSPEASTARPLMARTLKRATRSMPAMPMAESRPPIVVGMRHTSRATSDTVSTVVPAYSPKGRMVTVAMRNSSDMPASRMARAISLGVRCRWAPSTRAIMRSRKVSPGSARDADGQAVADERRATCDRAADIGAGLLEDGRGFARDGGLVDEADALDDVAVTGDRLALLDDDDVALAKLGGPDILERAVGTAAMGRGLRSRPPQGRGLRAAAGLRDGLRVGGEEDREPQPDSDLELEAGIGAGRGL